MSVDDLHDEITLSKKVKRSLVAVTLFIFVIALVDMARLWPNGRVAPSNLLDNGKLAYAKVIGIAEPCSYVGASGGGSASLQCFPIKVTSGLQKNTVASVQDPFTQGNLQLKNGQSIIVSNANDVSGQSFYAFYDYNRNFPVWIIFMGFAFAVIGLSRLQGLRAIIGIAISFLCIALFLLPAMLKNENALEVAFVGAVIVLYINLFLTHGFSFRTTTAVLGTFCSLILIAGLSAIFVPFAHLTGLSSDEVATLANIHKNLDVRGLLLGGFVIGALGVLLDVTVTQVSTVWEINKTVHLTGRQLYKSGMRVGRDHITSTVNTLVFAYAGASLPLMLLFVQSAQPTSAVITSEVVAVELFRTLIGAIGLVASVPITTALAAYLASRDQTTSTG